MLFDHFEPHGTEYEEQVLAPVTQYIIFVPASSQPLGQRTQEQIVITMGGHIDCYLDCGKSHPLNINNLSQLTKLPPPSIALQSRRSILPDQEPGEALEPFRDSRSGPQSRFHPVFLGGINVGSGNKPPWSLPAKAAYGSFDTARTFRYHGLKPVSTPSFFPPLTLLPQRALCFVKAKYPARVFEETWIALFNAMWYGHRDITVPDIFDQVLRETGLFDEAKGHVDEILEATKQKEWKDALLKNTDKVLAQGAFGAPWTWVRNAEGKEEPFFGSDRFHFMWDFLGLPYQDLEILPKPKEQAKL
ncbi:dsba family oxidoreductase [Phlyctema vagabunda]|uniref:Dsba family oxidoreductase n=1 Tax=Phlyctema vagabunda TaxID=108571 RepID=A0ABR4P7Y5_9HELO